MSHISRALLIAAVLTWLIPAQGQQTITIYQTNSSTSPPLELWSLRQGKWSALPRPNRPDEVVLSAQPVCDTAGNTFLIVGTVKRWAVFQREGHTWKEVWNQLSLDHPCDGSGYSHALSPDGTLYVAIADHTRLRVVGISKGRSEWLPDVPKSESCAYPVLAVDSQGRPAVAFRQFLREGNRSLGERIAAQHFIGGAWKALESAAKSTFATELYPRAMTFDANGHLYLGFTSQGESRGSKVLRLSTGRWEELKGGDGFDLYLRSLQMIFDRKARLLIAGTRSGSSPVGVAWWEGSGWRKAPLPESVALHDYALATWAQDTDGTPVLIVAAAGKSPRDLTVHVLGLQGDTWELRATRRAQRYLSNLRAASGGGETFVVLE